MKNFLILLTLIITFTLAFSQKTTRAKLKTEADTPVAIADTLLLDSGMVVISGYEKELRSTVESFFITNKGPKDLNNITLTITYMDMAGRKLHERTEDISVPLPAGDTRMVRIPSWDRQKVWYYYLSNRPRTRSQATPFRVALTPRHSLLPR